MYVAFVYLVRRLRHVMERKRVSSRFSLGGPALAALLFQLPLLRSEWISRWCSAPFIDIRLPL